MAPNQHPGQYNIRLYQSPDLHEVCQFVAGLNNQPEHHIAYFGISPGEIEYYLLEEQTIPPEESYLLAYSKGSLTGVIGLEYDLELGRAWIEGPLISNPEWNRLANLLYEQIVEIIPPGINDYELAGDTRNLNLERFAVNRGYLSNGDSALLVFMRSSLSHLPKYNSEKLTQESAVQFQALHDEIFPGTYYNGKQLFEKIDSTHQVFVESATNRLLGYVFAYVAPEIGDAYIDFIGVQEGARRRGTGRKLLVTALNWIFSFDEVQRVGLAVEDTNTAAVKLYQSCGFFYERKLRGYRLKTPSI